MCVFWAEKEGAEVKTKKEGTDMPGVAQAARCRCWRHSNPHTPERATNTCVGLRVGGAAVCCTAGLAYLLAGLGPTIAKAEHTFTIGT